MERINGKIGRILGAGLVFGAIAMPVNLVARPGSREVLTKVTWQLPVLDNGPSSQELLNQWKGRITEISHEYGVSYESLQLKVAEEVGDSRCQKGVLGLDKAQEQRIKQLLVKIAVRSGEVGKMVSDNYDGNHWWLGYSQGETNIKSSIVTRLTIATINNPEIQLALADNYDQKIGHITDEGLMAVLDKYGMEGQLHILAAYMKLWQPTVEELGTKLGWNQEEVIRQLAEASNNYPYGNGQLFALAAEHKVDTPKLQDVDCNKEFSWSVNESVAKKRTSRMWEASAASIASLSTPKPTPEQGGRRVNLSTNFGVVGWRGR